MYADSCDAAILFSAENQAKVRHLTRLKPLLLLLSFYNRNGGAVVCAQDAKGVMILPSAIYA